MYRVMMRQGWDGEEVCIHSDYGDEPRMLSGKIAKSTDAFPTLEFSVAPSNLAFGNINPYQTFFRVLRPDKQKVLFEGRAIKDNPQMTTDGQVDDTVSVNGLEDILHDSVQPFKEYRNVTPKVFLQALITEHNKVVEDYKQVKLGAVMVTNSTDNVYRFTDDTADTFNTIQDKLVSRLGGEIRIRREADGLYLDYEPEIAQQSNQVIRLSDNMLSMARTLDPTGVVPILKPLGKAADRTSTGDDSTQETSTPRMTISSVNDGSPYIRDEKLIALYGEITVAKTWDDVTIAKNLLANGKAFMAAQKAVSEQLTVTAADLSLIDASIDDFDCGNYQPIQNQLLGVDANRRIVTQTIDICAPTSSSMTLGDVALTIEQYNRQVKQAAKQAASLVADYATMRGQLNAIGTQVTGLDKTVESISISAAALDALRAVPEVKLSPGPKALMLTYTITPGAVAGVSYTAQICQDLNSWSTGSTITDLSATFTVAAAGDYFVRVKATVGGYDSPWSQPARITITA